MQPSNEPTSLWESTWWGLFEDEQQRYHVAPWNEAENSVAGGHIIGDCWCQPDAEPSGEYGTLYLHRDPYWPNSAESVN